MTKDLTTNGGYIKRSRLTPRKPASKPAPTPTQYRPQSPYKVHYTLTGASYPEGKNDRHKFNF